MDHRFDCVVAGECCVDLPIRPVPVEQPLGRDSTLRIDPIVVGSGGIVSNSGIAMARLGVRAAALAYVGRDHWGQSLRDKFDSEGFDTTYLLATEHQATSVTAVLGDQAGEHSFAFHAGASQQLDRHTIEEHLNVLSETKWLLLGYYALMPQLEDDLPEVLSKVRAAGCKVAMDAAAGGGSFSPLDRILPHLDAYVPSYVEAESQTGRSDPKEMIRVYRDCGCQGLLGVKLGKQGALLSPPNEPLLQVPPVTPPGPVVDTTGAGDCFYAGLIAGLVRGLPFDQCGKVAAAAGACSVTEVGGTGGVRDWDETLALASR